MRMRLPALAAAAVLTLGLAACGNNAATTSPETTAGATATAPATEAPVTEASAAEGGQATPRAAAEVMLRAFGSGDGRAACAIMSSGTQVMEGNEPALRACEEALQGLVDQLGQLAPQLKDATVTGATVDGDTATFENATVTPDIGQGVLSNMKATKISGKWYMSQ